MKDTLKALGGLLGILLLLVAGLFLVALLVFGAGWFSRVLMPWFAFASILGFAFLLLVLIPASLFRKTRTLALTAIFCVSYIFGATAWMEAFLTTLAFWGVFGVVIGLILGGVGIVPIAVLASIFHGAWHLVFELIALCACGLGARFYVFWAAERDDLQSQSTFRAQAAGLQAHSQSYESDQGEFEVDDDRAEAAES